MEKNMGFFIGPVTPTAAANGSAGGLAASFLGSGWPWRSDLLMGGVRFVIGVPPVIIHFSGKNPIKRTNQLLGYPHFWKPHMREQDVEGRKKTKLVGGWAARHRNLKLKIRRTWWFHHDGPQKVISVLHIKMALGLQLPWPGAGLSWPSHQRSAHPVGME